MQANNDQQQQQQLQKNRMMISNSNNNKRKKIDFCQMEIFKKFQNPYYCVISNDEYDFICHRIFIMAMSDYFRSLFDQTEDYYDYCRKKIPRIYLKQFDNHTLESFIKFAYTLRLEHDDDDSLETLEIMKKLLEFSNYINCVEMMEYLQMKMMNFHLKNEK
ncbi:hypothetical protein BLA29_006653 [Euroglyphus maynei]|uniref:BTB domain-containing protein n=1 Tax=Euroglyphus maynei TaxID=6958 RepID=A0A1Y3AR63_EURMA|nr:hypothetical protein BLA29_006653 [Euroglyphus maynei]